MVIKLFKLNLKWRMRLKKRFDKEPVERDYRTEARNLIRPLTMTQKYSLYEIVNNQLQKTVNENRLNELKAVQRAIRETPYIDMYTLDRSVNGYKSEMAKTARPKDGYTKPNRRKV